MVGILTSVFFTFSWKFCLILPWALPFFFLRFTIPRRKIYLQKSEKIYDDVSLLESTNFRSQPITTDMATLTKQVKKFATDKKLEIETLKVREEYRREFIGNVSHELKTPLFTVQGYLSTLLDGGMKDKTIRKNTFSVPRKESKG